MYVQLGRRDHGDESGAADGEGSVSGEQ
jgi:hypothetical protein